MTNPDAAAEGACWTWRRSALLLLALCVPLFLIGLGHYDLDSKAEPREGLTAWEMIHSGDWMLPSLNGEQLPEKPLMFPWLVALLTLAIGEASEWATRLPAALSAIATVLVVLALGRRLSGPRGGFLAAALFATTFLTVSLGRRARVDMTLTLFVTSALYLFVCDFLDSEERPDAPPRKRGLALFWLAMALGTLTKGPLGALLPGLAIGPFVLLRGRLGYLKRLFAWRGVLLYVIVAGSWYAHGLLASGDAFAYRSFLMENFMMFFGEQGGGGHRHEVTFFVGHVFLQGLPWSFLLPAALAWSLRRGGGPWMQRPLALPLLWFAAMFAFFSVAAGKRADYLMPLLPAAALAVAAMLDESERAFADKLVRPVALAGTGLLAAIGTAGAVLGLAAVVLPAEHWPWKLPQTLSRPEIRAYLDLATQAPLPLALGVAGALAAFLSPFAGILRGTAYRCALAASIGVACAATASAFTVMPAYMAQASLKPFAAAVERAVPPSATIRNFGDFQPAVMFYLRRRLPVMRADRENGHPEIEAFLAEKGEAFVLTDVESSRTLLKRYPGRFEVAVRTGWTNAEATDEPVLLRRR